MSDQRQVLNRVSNETILLNAHRQLSRKYEGMPLWSFVSQTCAVGSHSAIEICRELGWNPEQDGAKLLERKAHLSAPSSPDTAGNPLNGILVQDGRKSKKVEKVGGIEI